MTQNNDEVLIAKKELLEDLVDRMSGVYSDYHKEIVQDELNDTLEAISNLLPISQNEQQPKQIPEGCAIVNVEDLINLAVSYCEDGMHPDDLERDIRAMLNAAPTNTEVGE